jgi:fructokinase
MRGAIEAGGTKFVCAVGSGPDDLRVIRIPTTTPAETLTAAINFLRPDARSVGIGSFGPVDLDPASATYGYITTTPKDAWRNCDFAGTVRRALGVPVAFDTDVDTAALGEARWGAGRGLHSFVYLTVGTGIGGGAITGGRILAGASHPEMGHLRIPHDFARDPFPGACPWHGDCLEGLASGPALAARWRCAPEELPADHEAWHLEAHYLALGLASLTLTLSPQRFLLGGGVMRQTQLFEMIREELARLIAGYVAVPEVLPPELGERSGILGALVLAETAA